MDDSVRLGIFQRSLTRSATKWYIELQGASFKIFNDLEMTFITHYQLPIGYAIGIELLMSLQHDTSTHIFDHIHELRQRHRMINTQILEKLPMEWFTKSLLPPTTKDITMVGETTEEKAIMHSQHLDLIYSE
jgi:hypothetical protein